MRVHPRSLPPAVALTVLSATCCAPPTPQAPPPPPGNQPDSDQRQPHLTADGILYYSSSEDAPTIYVTATPMH